MQNIFTVDNAAMLLIDHKQGTVKLAKNIAYDEIVSNTRALARTAIETGNAARADQQRGRPFSGAAVSRTYRKSRPTPTPDASSVPALWTAGSSRLTKRRSRRRRPQKTDYGGADE